MRTPSFKSYRCHVRQAGQGMTEYIIILVVIAIGSIFVYTQFGNTLRHQTAAAAKALAGQDGSTQTAMAQEAATAAAAGASKGGGMNNFGNPDSYGSPEGPGSSGGDRPGNQDGPGSPSDSGDPGGPGSPDGPGDPGSSKNPGDTTTLYGTVDSDNIAQPPVPSPSKSPLDDADVMALINDSPTLKKDMDKLIAKKWDIFYGATKNGVAETTGDKGDGKGEIIIDPKTYTAAKEAGGDSRFVVTALAHEIGHKPDTFKENSSSKEAFVDSLLLSEGDAILYGLKVREEIRCKGMGGDCKDKYDSPLNQMSDNDNIDIFMMGDMKFSEQLYDVYFDYKIGKIEKSEARAKIAEIYRKMPLGDSNYEEEYGKAYEEKYGKKP